MKLLMRAIRAIVGPILLLWDAIFKPKSVVRDPQVQEVVDSEAAVAVRAAAAAGVVHVHIPVTVPSVGETSSARRIASAVVEDRIRARAGGRDRRAKVEFIRQILLGRLRGRGGAGAALDRLELDRVEDEVVARTATAATAERRPFLK